MWVLTGVPLNPSYFFQVNKTAGEGVALLYVFTPGTGSPQTVGLAHGSTSPTSITVNDSALDNLPVISHAFTAAASLNQGRTEGDMEFFLGEQFTTARDIWLIDYTNAPNNQPIGPHTSGTLYTGSSGWSLIAAYFGTGSPDVPPFDAFQEVW